MHALITCSSKKIRAYYMYALIEIHVLFQITASLSGEDAVYLNKSVVRGHHIYKRA